MKRRLLRLAGACSLLLSLAATAAWAASHARPLGWRLLGTAHSADLVREDRGRRTAVFTAAAGGPTSPIHGFWDAWWARSASGRLTLLAQVIDYEGRLRRVSASPPGLVVELAGPARQPAVVLDRLPASGSGANRLGFGWHADAHAVDGAGGPVGARAWMVTVPYWILVLLGLPMPLRWLYRARRRRGGAHAAAPPDGPTAHGSTRWRASRPPAIVPRT